MIRNGDLAKWAGDHPADWEFGAPREAIRPPLARSAGAVLSALPSGLSTGWLRQTIPVPPELAGRWLELTARVRVRGGQGWPETVRVSATWASEPNPRGWSPGRRFAPRPQREGELLVFRQSFPIPPRSKSVTVEFMQFGGTEGSAELLGMTLLPCAEPSTRRIRAAAAYYQPAGPNRTWEQNLEGIDRLAGEAKAEGCDLVLFGEGVSVVGTGKSYVDVARPIPGPHADDLARVAARHRIFLCAGLYERDGAAAYNTAVLYDRAGRLAGKYRKVHLPWPEIEAGLVPGSEFPVFDTEIGRIGIQICYDHHFVESARSLAVNGAEIILTPIWGDLRSDGEVYDATARSRALDNGVFYLMSVYSLKRSLIVDPHGRILATTAGDGPNLAVADLDLLACVEMEQPYRIPPNHQLGQFGERRPGAYGSLLAGMGGK